MKSEHNSLPIIFIKSHIVSFTRNYDLLKMEKWFYKIVENAQF